VSDRRLWRRIYSSTMFLKLNREYSSHVLEHGAVTLFAEGTSLNLVGVGDSLCFHCLEACFNLRLIAVSPDLIERYNCIASPPPLSCSTAGCQEMSSFIWHAVPALAVLSPIDSENWDHWTILCAECFEISVCWTVSEIVPVWLEGISYGSHGIGRRNNMPARSFLINNAFCAASKLRTLNMYCWSRKNTCHHTLDASQSESHLQ